MLPPLKIDQARFEQGGWARIIAPSASTIPALFEGQPVPRDDQGRFFIAFDRDAAPASFIDYATIALPLTIAPRPWRIEQVNTPLRPPAMPDEAFAKIRSAEVERINAARAVGAQAEGWRQTFQWPAKGRLSGLFGSQRVYQGTPGAYHGGTDIALPAGTVYNAPADGVVVLAADHPFTLEGNLLMIDHGMGLISAFLHSSALLVREGERVVQGQPIGRVGMTGRATGPHLHWGMRWREARLDPMLFAGGMA
jgi:murein DD-endopeptidase MepM/ murein hydrolase activator NlpD